MSKTTHGFKSDRACDKWIKVLTKRLRASVENQIPSQVIRDLLRTIITNTLKEAVHNGDMDDSAVMAATGSLYSQIVISNWRP